MKTILSNKKILFISPHFFDYEKKIEKELISLNAEVYFYDERCNASTIDKIFIRLGLQFFIKKKIFNYYLYIINNFKQNFFDFVFFIKAETISSILLHKLHKTHPKAKFILYLWDSIANNSNINNLITNFDKIFSFDKNDCVKYNFSFLPLFYSIKSDLQTQYDYDLCFIGTIHSDRYNVIKKINKYCIDKGLKIFLFMYFQNIFLYYKSKLLYPEFRKARKDFFKFTPLLQEETSEIISKSRIVIDIQHPAQTGLTIRTLEILGMQKKIITTNKNIENYDFYNVNNIAVIDRDKPEISSDFFQTSYTPLPSHILEKYCLKSWIESIFSTQ